MRSLRADFASDVGESKGKEVSNLDLAYILILGAVSVSDSKSGWRKSTDERGTDIARSE